MHLDVMTESRLAELFGKAAPSVSPRTLNATYLQRQWLGALPAVQRFAIQGARVMSYSYRNFRVGAAAYCYCSRTNEFGIVNAGNLKLHACLSKYCAETGDLDFVDTERWDRFIGFAIYGEEVQPDPSGHAPRTLHPCPACRAKMAADHRIARWTRIFTFRPWMEGDDPAERNERYVREHMSFRQLQRAHANGNGHH